jgi:hypothetical protein
MLASLVVGLLLSATIAAGLAAVGRWKRSSEGPVWWAAGAVGLAYAAAHVALARPAWPPVDVTDRVPYLALAAAALAMFEAVVRPRPVVRSVGRAVLALATLAVVLGPVLAGELPQETLVWLVATLVVAPLAWINVAALAACEPFAAVRALVVTTVGAGVAAVLAGSATLSQCALALAAALVAWQVVGREKVVGSTAASAAAVLSALVVIGFVYASLPAWSAGLIACSPAAAWVERIGPISTRRVLVRVTVGAIAVAAPLAAAVAIAARESPPYGY